MTTNVEKKWAYSFMKIRVKIHSYEEKVFTGSGKKIKNSKDNKQQG